MQPREDSVPAIEYAAKARTCARPAGQDTVAVMSTEKQLPSTVALALIAVVLALFAISLADGWFRIFAIIGALLMAALAVVRVVADQRSKPQG